MHAQAAFRDWYFSLDGATQGCGVAADGTASCWDDYAKIAELCKRGSSNCTAGGAPPTGEKFKQVTVYQETGCGVTSDGRILCWGDPREGFTPPPTGNDFTRVTFAGAGGVCALRSNGHVLCAGGAEQPGPYQQYAFDESGVCALRTDGSVECWGSYDALAMQPGATGLAQLSRWDSSLCGLSKDGAARCWNIRNDTHEGLPDIVQLPSFSNSLTSYCAFHGSWPPRSPQRGQPDRPWWPADRSEATRSLVSA